MWPSIVLNPAEWESNEETELRRKNERLIWLIGGKQNYVKKVEVNKKFPEKFVF